MAIDSASDTFSIQQRQLNPMPDVLTSAEARKKLPAIIADLVEHPTR